MNEAVPKFEKVIRNRKVAVLYSPGFGAGWSSWAGDPLRDFALFDSGLVALAEKSAPESEVEEYIKSRIGDEYFYTGGWRDIQIEWLAAGTAFEIHEYDGSESIKDKGRIDWCVA